MVWPHQVGGCHVRRQTGQRSAASSPSKRAMACGPCRLWSCLLLPADLQGRPQNSNAASWSVATPCHPPHKP